jgi:hypothetical protein
MSVEVPDRLYEDFVLLERRVKPGSKILLPKRRRKKSSQSALHYRKRETIVSAKTDAPSRRTTITSAPALSSVSNISKLLALSVVIAEPNSEDETITAIC